LDARLKYRKGLLRVAMSAHLNIISFH